MKLRLALVFAFILVASIASAQPRFPRRPS